MSRSAWSAVLTALLIVSLVALCGCKKGDKEEQTTASGTQAPAAKATPGPATSGPAGKAAAKATEAPGPAPELTAGPPKATARKAPAAAPGETKPAEFPKLTRRIIARPNVKSPLRKDLSPEELAQRYLDRAYKHWETAWRLQPSGGDQTELVRALANALMAKRLNPADENVDRILDTLAFWLAPTGAVDRNPETLLGGPPEHYLGFDPDTL